MRADLTPASGRVLCGASLRQGVGVKPWEKALVQRPGRQVEGVVLEAVFGLKLVY